MLEPLHNWLKQIWSIVASVLMLSEVKSAQPRSRRSESVKPTRIKATGSQTGQRKSRLSRWQERLRDREWRRYAYVLLLGKFVALLLLMLVVIPIVSHIVGDPAMAADPQLKGNDVVNPINTVWTLIAAFLVFAMQVGFTMLEAGFCRSRETVNVLMECIVDTCLCGLLFFAIGFSFMFSHGNGLIGLNCPSSIK